MSKNNILPIIAGSILLVGAAIGVYIFQSNAVQERAAQAETVANIQKAQESIERDKYYKEQLKRFDKIGR